MSNIVVYRTIVVISNIVVYRILVTEDVFMPLEMRSLKNYRPRTNVFVMPHHTLPLASCKGTSSTSRGFSSSHWTQFFEFTFLVKEKYSSFVHNIRSGRGKIWNVATLLLVSRLQHLDALKSTRKHSKNRELKLENCDFLYMHTAGSISYSMQWTCSNRIMLFRNNFNRNRWSSGSRSISIYVCPVFFFYEITYSSYGTWATS